MKKSLLAVLSLALALPSFGQENDKQYRSLRELFYSGSRHQFLFVSPSETETLLVKNYSGDFSIYHAKEICQALGGKAYLVKVKKVEGFGGNYVIEEKIPAEERSGFLGFLKSAWVDGYALPTLCEKDGKEIFFSETGRWIGNWFYTNYGCYVHRVRHIPEPKITSFEIEDRDKIKSSNSLFEYLQTVKAKFDILPDGSYKTKDSAGECSPFDTSYLRKSANYCYQKGGTFKRADGQDLKELITKLLTTEPPKNVYPVDLWLKEFDGHTFYCDGPEKFMVYVEVDKQRRRPGITAVPYVFYFRQGIDQDLLEKAQEKIKKAQAKTVSEDAIISMIKMTASSKTPSMQVIGQMRYDTIYMYPDGGCDLVALITRGPGYTQIDNFKVCQDSVNSTAAPMILEL
jgi:predicted GNAT family acetyltransferase